MSNLKYTRMADRLEKDPCPSPRTLRAAGEMLRYLANRAFWRAEDDRSMRRENRDLWREVERMRKALAKVTTGCGRW